VLLLLCCRHRRAAAYLRHACDCCCTVFGLCENLLSRCRQVYEPKLSAATGTGTKVYMNINLSHKFWKDIHTRSWVRNCLLIVCWPHVRAGMKPCCAPLIIEYSRMTALGFRLGDCGPLFCLRLW
jgi:hypothetical protein